MTFDLCVNITTFKSSTTPTHFIVLTGVLSNTTATTAEDLIKDLTTRRADPEFILSPFDKKSYKEILSMLLW